MGVGTFVGSLWRIGFPSVCDDFCRHNLHLMSKETLGRGPGVCFEWFCKTTLRHARNAPPSSSR
eukprot:6482215-Amphidinium_carterae.3